MTEFNDPGGGENGRDPPLIDRIVDVLVVIPRHAPSVQMVARQRQRPVEVPQAWYPGRAADVAMAIQRQAFRDVATPGSHDQESSENHEHVDETAELICVNDAS